jgi:hypothetical protein
MTTVHLHQTSGCFIEWDRWFIFSRVTGAQVVDQPRRGFRSSDAAWDFLRFQELDLRLYAVAVGRDALLNEAVEGLPIGGVMPASGEGGDQDERQQHKQERVHKDAATDGDDGDDDQQG